MSNGNQTGAEKRFGLTLRFEVNVDNHDLGHWQQCTGLEVSYAPADVKEMGDNTSVRRLIGQTTYPSIVLTRAMEKDQSLKTMAWLADAQQSQTREKSATIRLLDAWGGEVATWTLENVIPIKWQGPSLDATKSQVALEKLTLAHEGFQELAGSEKVVKAKIYEHDNPSKVLNLQFNPQSLTKFQAKTLGGHASYDQRGGKSGAGKNNPAGGPGTNAGRAYGNGSLLPCRYQLNKVVFDSHYSPDPGQRSIAEVVDLLFSWMEPINAKPPTTQMLHFAWGQLHDEHIKCSLTANTVTYERLDPDGTPSRITVNITLQEQPDEPQGTNPTSGGPGGHRARLLVADESLAAVAYQEYGDAGLWPQLAKFNAIDDPTRLTPGTSIQVPPMAVLGRR